MRIEGLVPLMSIRLSLVVFCPRSLEWLTSSLTEHGLNMASMPPQYCPNVFDIYSLKYEAQPLKVKQAPSGRSTV
jgi:hypothetical protein